MVGSQELRRLPQVAVIGVAVYHEDVDSRSLLDEVEASVDAFIQHSVGPHLNGVE
jgi:hypothetical protein